MKSFIIHVVKYLKLTLEKIFPLFKCKPNVDIIEISYPYQSTFCGYYDLNPFRPQNNNFLLLHCSNIKPYANDPYSEKQIIAVYDIVSGETKELCSTSAWNWQQGARLTWLNSEEIIFNDFDRGRLISKVIDLNGNILRIGPPFYCNFGVGKYLSCDFVNLSQCSEYGYDNLRKEKGKNIIKIVDYIKDIEEIFIDLNTITEPTAKNANNLHFNHFLPSPTQVGLIFVRRYFINNIRYDDLFYLDVHNLSCNLILKAGMASHFCWLTDNLFLAWCSGPDNKNGYYLFDVKEKVWNLFDMSGDGHPTRLDGNYFLTETQKGTKSYQFIEYDLRVRSINDPNWNRPLLKIGHPTILKGYQRCDMHVSVSDDNSWFQVDSLQKVHKRTVIIGSLK